MGQGKRSDATNFEENKRDFQTYNDDAGIYELKRGMNHQLMADESYRMIHDQSLTSRK